MKMNILLKLTAVCAITAMVLAGCDKDEDITIPPGIAHFTNLTSGTYIISTPTTTFSIPVGIASVSDRDRTITVNVSSPTGAVQGTHYTLASSTVVIPAGKAVDSIVVQGAYDQYLSGRQDTLVFTLSGADITVAEYNPEFRLFVRGACNEGDVDLNQLLGDYENTNEDLGGSTYGPYTTTITAVTQNPAASTGTITVANIFDAGWNPITFQLDWSDPANRVVTVSPSPQPGIGNAGTVFGAAYNGEDLMVANHASGEVGTFSICNQTLTLKMQIGITGLGFAGELYTVTMAR
jgi:hypothetical protein